MIDYFDFLRWKAAGIAADYVGPTEVGPNQWQFVLPFKESAMGFWSGKRGFLIPKGAQ
jgi:hypothetical protein